MVRFVANDLETAIDLLQQDDAHHLMGEGHGGKGKFEICPPADCGRQPQRAAYDEDDAAFPLKPQFLDLCRKLRGRKPFSVDLQGDHMIGRLDFRQDRLTFRFLDCRLIRRGCVGWKKALLQLCDLQIYNAFQPLGVFRFGIAPVLFL